MGVNLGSKMKKNDLWWKMPESVLTDSKLEHSQKVLYLFLVRSWLIATELNHGSKPYATLGIQKMSRITGMGTRTLRLGLQQLDARGHIQIVRNGKSRNIYNLLASGCEKEKL